MAIKLVSKKKDKNGKSKTIIIKKKPGTKWVPGRKPGLKKYA